MCDKCDNPLHQPAKVGRRQVFLGAAGIAAAGSALVGEAAKAAETRAGVGAGVAAPQQTGAFTTRAWAARGPELRFSPTSIERRALGPRDVRIDILYAGICHSDIHTIRGDWGTPNYPVVPGHEMIGRVTAVGSAVVKFKVGDMAGVGCMVDSCGSCENCLADREQNCLRGTTFTYDAPDKVSGGFTKGGYSQAVVVTEAFALRIAAGANLPGMTPILCAGITTYSPMQHWRLGRGQRVAVVGLGGLGHMALKLGVARQAEVTVFTTTPGKQQDAIRMGAKEAVLWSDSAAMTRLAGHFDLIIATVPYSYPVQQFMDLLKLDGTLVNVGALVPLDGLDGMRNGFGRRSLAGSMIGGIAETQEVLDYCVARNIAADVEIIRPDQIAEAYRRILGKDVRYRFVIDMATA